MKCLFLLGKSEFGYLVLGPYYKSKLKLKLNSSEIFPVNCKFFHAYTILFCTESQTEGPQV